MTVIIIVVTFLILIIVILGQFLFPGEDKKLLDVLQKLQNHETVNNYSFKFLKKSGETHRMLVDSNATFESDGSFGHARCVIFMLYFSTLKMSTVYTYKLKHSLYDVHRCFIRPDKHFELREKLSRDKNKLSRKHTESRTAFIRNVFHEIRTPMHALSDFFCDLNPTREDFEDMKHHTGQMPAVYGFL